MVVLEGEPLGWGNERFASLCVETLALKEYQQPHFLNQECGGYPKCIQLYMLGSGFV